MLGYIQKAIQLFYFFWITFQGFPFYPKIKAKLAMPDRMQFLLICPILFLFARMVRRKYHRQGCLNTRYFHSSGGYKDKLTVSAGLVSFRALPWLVGGHPLSVTSHGLHLSAPKFHFSNKKASHIGLRPTLVTSFQLPFRNSFACKWH
jgi:hypothetical protein